MELNKVNNQQLLQELAHRVNSNELNEKQVVRILKEKKWRDSCRLASQDQTRDKEIAEWDKIESKINDHSK